MKLPFRGASWRRGVAISAALTALAALPSVPSWARAPETDLVVLKGHRPRLLARATAVARVAASETIHLALALSLHNPEGLRDLLGHLYTQGDPQQGDFLSPQTFASRFG